MFPFLCNFCLLNRFSLVSLIQCMETTFTIACKLESFMTNIVIIGSKARNKENFTTFCGVRKQFPQHNPKLPPQPLELA